MYRLHSEITFSAAHKLEGHPKCGRLHGHTYKVEVWVEGKKLNNLSTKSKNCVLIDFGRIKEVLEKIHKKFDHQYLNNVFTNNGKPIPPTCENLARYVYYYMRKVLRAKYNFDNIKITKVRVWEGLKNYAEFEE